MYGCAGANAMQVWAFGGVEASVALGNDEDGLFFTERLDELDRAFAAYGERQDGVREQHRVAYREDRDGAIRAGGGDDFAGFGSWFYDGDEIVSHG